MRLSRLFRQPAATPDRRLVPVRRAVLWAVVGLALLLGLALYFRYEPLVAPLVS